MDFLHRRRSIAFVGTETTSSAAPSGEIADPLPTTLPALPPHLTTTKMGAIENIPRTRAAPQSSTAGELIRRVSSMFSSRKKRPPALKLAGGSIPKIYESGNSSMQSLAESEDDIRRPSGLGSAASIASNRSLPPSPFVPTYDYNSVFGHTMANGFPRLRTTSSPNLLRSLSLMSKGSKKKGRERGDSVRSISRYGSQAQLRTAANILCIPMETMVIIFSHLSKSEVALVAHTCRLFSSASRTVLCGNVDLQDFTTQQLEKFIALLASRRDLTDLVRTFTCSTWPLFFLTTSSSPSTIPPKHQLNFHDADLQHRNTLLTATFTLAFQRMSNLTSLTLPGYDHDLLVHHTAFGLRSVRFTCSTLSIEESNELFAWLDGQTNITSLLFPNLLEDNSYGKDDALTLRPIPTTPRPVSSSGLPSPNRKYLAAPTLGPLPSPTSPSKLSRPKSASPSSPSYNTTTFPSSVLSSPLPSPQSASHKVPPSLPSPSSSTTKFPSTNTSHTQYPTSPLSSPTLLPNLTAFHGPPSLLIALAASDPNDNRRPRPLKNVIVNISSTLYSGLRPAMIMNKLTGVTRRLGLWFGENVDRRTVEKVLGAAGSALGGNLDPREQDERFGSGFKFGDGEWKGLVELDVVFLLSSPAVPGTDEAMHKMISSVIPRYPRLRVLQISHLHSPEMTETPLALSPATPTPATATSRPNSLGGYEAYDPSNGFKKSLSPPEQAYVRNWTKHCPHLRKVAFLSTSEWHRK